MLGEVHQSLDSPAVQRLTQGSRRAGKTGYLVKNLDGFPDQNPLVFHRLKSDPSSRSLNQPLLARLRQGDTQSPRKLEHLETVIRHRHNDPRVRGCTSNKKNLPVPHRIIGIHTCTHERGQTMRPMMRPHLRSDPIIQSNKKLHSKRHDLIMPPGPFRRRP